MDRSPLVDAICTDTRVKVEVVLSDGRVLVSIPLELLRTDPLFTAGRSGSPDITALTRTTKEGVLYPILVFAGLDQDGNVLYIIVDGHQRVRSLIENRIAVTMCIINPNWTSKQAAFEQGIMANAIRTMLSEGDALEIFAGGNVSIPRMSELTTFSTTTLTKLARIARYPTLHKLIVEGLISSGRLASLLEATKNDPVRVARLLKVMQVEYDNAHRLAGIASAELARREGQQVDAKLQRQALPKTHFGNINFESLKAGLAKADQTSELEVKRGGTAKKSLRVGGDVDWQTDVAIYVAGPGMKHEEASPEDILRFLQALPTIKLKMEAIYAKLTQSTAPLPSLNPEAPAREDRKVKKQDSNFTPKPE